MAQVARNLADDDGLQRDLFVKRVTGTGGRGAEAWYYDAQQNAVVFFDAYIPAAGALVEITYQTA